MYRVRYWLLDQVILVLLTSNSKDQHRVEVFFPFFLVINLKLKRSANTKSVKAEKGGGKVINENSIPTHLVKWKDALRLIAIDLAKGSFVTRVATGEQDLYSGSFGDCCCLSVQCSIVWPPPHPCWLYYS